MMQTSKLQMGIKTYFLLIAKVTIVIFKRIIILIWVQLRRSGRLKPTIGLSNK